MSVAAIDKLCLDERNGNRMIVAVICDVLGEENNGTTIAAMNLIRTLREKGTKSVWSVRMPAGLENQIIL